MDTGQSEKVLRHIHCVCVEDNSAAFQKIIGCEPAPRLHGSRYASPIRICTLPSAKLLPLAISITASFILMDNNYVEIFPEVSC